MQRRKLVDQRGGGGIHKTTSSSTSKPSSQNKYILPMTITPTSTTTTTTNTTINSSSGTSMNKITFHKSKQRKKLNTVTLLVQTIIFLMIATSATLIYIAVKRTYRSSSSSSSSSSVGDMGGSSNLSGGKGGGEVFKNTALGDILSNVDVTGGGDGDHDDGVVEAASHAPIKEEVTEHEQGKVVVVQEEVPDTNNQQGISIDEQSQQQQEEQQQQQQHDESSHHLTEKKRTTAEANAYMNQQPSFSVDGEKALKKKLYPLHDLQREGHEKLSPIITRWVGEQDENGQELKYWLPKSSTSEEVLQGWRDSVEKMKDVFRKKDVELFPHLHVHDLGGGTSLEDILKDKTHKNAGSSTSTSSSSNSSSTSSRKLSDYSLPSPDGTHVVLKPTFGKHRENVDAVFALAEGYDLKIYLLFIESLKATGFNGDLVLSVSALGSLKPGVEEYLRSNQIDGDNEKGVNVVAYTVTWTCYNGKGEVTEGANEGIRKCELVGMYGEDADEHIVHDPRDARPVATARFELYWAWSQYYKDENWIMLIDSRDAHFQRNPFTDLPREINGENGLLYFFAVSLIYQLSVHCVIQHVY